MRFWVVNTVRRVETRMNRAQSPLRHRFSQTICGGIRLVRNQPHPLLVDQLKSFYDELYNHQENGILEVRENTPDGPKHDFREAGLKWRMACAAARIELAQKKAGLVKAGDVEAAKALVLELPAEPVGAFNFVEGLSMPKVEARHEPSESEAPEAEVEAGVGGTTESESDEEGDRGAEEAAPDMTWTKTDLVEYAARMLPADPAELEEMTKRQILHKLEG